MQIMGSIGYDLEYVKFLKRDALYIQEVVAFSLSENIVYQFVEQ